MTEAAYLEAGLMLGRQRSDVTPEEIRALQRDLRALGYLRRGIDGKFGKGTEDAVKAVQYDLLHNDGSSRGSDGPAPVRVLDFNRARVSRITGEVDQDMAAAIADMAQSPAFPKLPETPDPVAENRRIAAEISAMSSAQVPIPFLVAILRQESGLKHFNEPRGGDQDRFIVVGLDTNASQKYIVTSRGYGAGQYTLFHHPPREEEVRDFMLDVGKNLGKAVGELRWKYDNFVTGSSSGTRADDRIQEQGTGRLRPCMYSAGDPRFLKDCANCAAAAGRRDIAPGTPVYQGSKIRFEPTQYYRSAAYPAVPVRKNFPCDWPYAVRRYNGAGLDSYHYQVRVLSNLVAG